KSDLPEKIVLEQNYPNPFNPSTVISYQLPVNSVVKLQIYDMLGREVATLIDGERKAAGKYNVTFNAGNLASGIYIYQLKVGNSIFTKKLSLIK
ncbi:MAG: T9SS type A sorting domain-containing protein, partial [Balneolaceae bacterium]